MHSMTQEDKPFDLFFRNPHNYWKQLQEVAECNVAWDRELLYRHKIDPHQFSMIKFNNINPNWRAYVVGKNDAQEYRAGNSYQRPFASYPTFNWYNQQLDALEKMLYEPWGLVKEYYNDPEWDIKSRPVKGQPHKIFIEGVPPPNQYAGRHALELLAGVQQKWTGIAELFIHRNTGAFDKIFGYNFEAGSYDGRSLASYGRIILPNGKTISPRDFDPKTLKPYLELLGFTYDEILLSANMCKYNIQSIRYASKTWNTPGRIPKIRFTRKFKQDAPTDKELGIASKDHRIVDPVKKLLPVAWETPVTG